MCITVRRSWAMEEEDVERLEPKGMHREEVRGPDLWAVILKEGAPGRRRVARAVSVVATDRLQADMKAQLAQLPKYAHVSADQTSFMLRPSRGIQTAACSRPITSSTVATRPAGPDIALLEF